MNKAPFVFAFFSCWSLGTLAQVEDPALSAGGLAPPPAVEGQGAAPGAGGTTAAPGTASPDQALEEADREDSGRGLEFVWLNGEVGITHIGLGTISDDNMTQPGLPSPNRSGLLLGAGAGVRLLFFTAGARFRWAKVTNNFFKHWSVGGEAAVHFPLGSFEPYVGLGAGYSRFWDVSTTQAGNLAGQLPGTNPNDPAGLHVRLLGGADYYLTNMFSVGLNVSGEMLMLWREATPGAPANDVNSVDASSIGAAVSATAVVGLHFSQLMRALAAALPLFLALLLYQRVRKTERPARGLVLLVAFGGAVTGALAVYGERLVLAFTDLTFEVARSGTGGALLATFLLAAPLEEGLKVLVVWALYRRQHVQRARLGLLYAASTAAGFSAVEAVLGGPEVLDGVGFVRLLLSAPATLFFAGVWGYALGAAHRHDRWFTLAWLVAMLLHGLYDHILWGRGPGLLVVLIPMLLFMGLGTYMALRGEGGTVSEFEPPSLEHVRARLAKRDRPLMVGWIVLGAFVTMGLIILLVALSVVAGNRLGVDFALADEADVRSSGPLVLLGTAVLAAFPLSGYVVARASSGQGLLEPALAAALTLGLLVFLLWLAAPIGVLFALAVAPIALGLACGGAWIGLER